VAAALSPSFEEQGYIEHNQRFAARAGPIEKSLFLRHDHRVKNPFKPLKRRGVSQYASSESRAVDPTLFGLDARKGRRYTRHGGTVRREQSMNNLIGVKERNPQAA
jgi:hypothetical protein